jgi:hypothetical protein
MLIARRRTPVGDVDIAPCRRRTPHVVRRHRGLPSQPDVGRRRLRANRMACSQNYGIPDHVACRHNQQHILATR